MGRQGGCSTGKGGSMHFYKESGFYGGYGIVGAQVPLGCGLAFAQKYSEDDTVTLLYMVMVLLPIRDNCLKRLTWLRFGICLLFWSVRTIIMEWRAAKSPAYYKRGDYAPGLKVDGVDAFAVKQACKFAKEHALKNGPIILEMDTYRYHSHSMSDPGSTYCTRDEISGVRQESAMPDPSELFTNVYVKGFGVQAFGADRK